MDIPVVSGHGFLYRIANKLYGIFNFMNIEICTPLETMIVNG